MSSPKSGTESGLISGSVKCLIPRMPSLCPVLYPALFLVLQMPYLAWSKMSGLVPGLLPGPVSEPINQVYVWQYCTVVQSCVLSHISSYASPVLCLVPRLVLCPMLALIRCPVQFLVRHMAGPAPCQDLWQVFCQVSCPTYILTV